MVDRIPTFRPPARLCLFLLLSLALLADGRTPSATAAELGIGQDQGIVRLTLQGEEGQEYSLETIESLLNAGHVWKSVATVAPGSGPAALLDPTCTTRPQNFYRLRLLQGGIPVGVPNFRLLDLQGRAQELFYQADAKAVALVFTGPDLSLLGSQDASGPSARDQVAHLRALQQTHATRGLRTWIIAETAGPDRTALAARAAELGLDLPVLADEGGVVTRAICGGTVPEAVLLEPGFWQIRYRGRIRDVLPAGPGGTGPAPQTLLQSAVEQHLAGAPVVVREAAVEGTRLASRDFSGRTYAQDIAPLLRQRCVKCHSPGNIAPWAMTNHTIVRDFAPAMKDEILARRMPPWHADRQPQSYSNDDMLSGDEMALLVDWIDRGAPRGEGTDLLETSVPAPPPEWPLGTPDRVVSLERQTIPANGTVDYRYAVLANPFPGDVWLRAAAFKPGNTRVMHHALVFAATSFAEILQLQAGLGGYFAAYVPGMEQVAFPEGTGKLLKRGAFLVFQLHYTAKGTPETDLSQLGFYLAPTPPAAELRTAAAYDLGFVIPPGAADHTTTAEYTLTRDSVVYEFSPHMHYRGSWFRFEALYPDDRREVLLNVPYYRFDWQTLYRLQEPKRLPAGTRIVTTGGWDNSARNPYNNDPGASVRFGEQSWEEMFIGYFNYAPAP